MRCVREQRARVVPSLAIIAALLVREGVHGI